MKPPRRRDLHALPAGASRRGGHRRGDGRPAVVVFDEAENRLHAQKGILAWCILHFVWGRYCNYRASKAMGANLVAPIQQWNLLVTLVLAIVVLGEELTPLRLLGIGLVVLGPMLTYERRRGKAAGAKAVPDKPRMFQPNYAEGYTVRAPVLDRLRGQPDPGSARHRERRLAGRHRRRPCVLRRRGAGVLGRAAAARPVAACARLDPEAAKWFVISGVVRLLRADAALHGAGARAGVGGDADPAAVDRVPRLLQPRHQPGARDVRRAGDCGDGGVAGRRDCAVGQHRPGAVRSCRCRTGYGRC
jgi:hypothetical protein